MLLSALQHNKPLYSFEDNADYVYDVMWSPVHPALFACVDGMGRLDLWNLNNDTEVRRPGGGEARAGGGAPGETLTLWEPAAARRCRVTPPPSLPGWGGAPGSLRARGARPGARRGGQSPLPGAPHRPPPPPRSRPPSRLPQRRGCGSRVPVRGGEGRLRHPRQKANANK